MACEIIAQPMRFPKKLITIVDQYISKENQFTTRPDFILDAIRFSYGKLTEKYADIYESTHAGKSGYDLYKGREKELMRVSGEVLLSEYQDYGRETIQVMLRIPKGLADLIDMNILGIDFCKNRSDFIRISVIYKLSYIEELNEIWKKAEEYNKEVKEDLRNSVVDTILKGFKDKSLFETAKEVSKQMNKSNTD